MDKNLIEYSIKDIPVKIHGRNVAGAGKSDAPVSLFWSGSGIEINVKASEVWALVESDFSVYESWLAIWIDGRMVSRFMAQKGKNWICLGRGFSSDTPHRFFIMKDTQAMSGDGEHLLFVHKIAVSEGTEFMAIPESDLKIEFIGDSITSGEGLRGAVSENDWISSWISASECYAVQASMELGADFRIMSQCGWGIVTGWDNNINCKIPPHYEKVCSILQGENQKKAGSCEDYDFSEWQPNLVFVNLGTNDNSAFSQPAWKDPSTGKEYKMRLDKNGKILEEDGMMIAAAVKKFLETIRKNNPSAVILWATGMIKIDDTYIKMGIQNYIDVSGDKKVEYVLLEGMENEKLDCEKGSRGHPGPFTHKKAADWIVNYVKGASKNFSFWRQLAATL